MTGHWESDEHVWRLQSALEIIGFDAEESGVEILLLGSGEPSPALQLMMESLNTDARVSYRKVCRCSALSSHRPAPWSSPVSPLLPVLAQASMLSSADRSRVAIRQADIALITAQWGPQCNADEEDRALAVRCMSLSCALPTLPVLGLSNSQAAATAIFDSGDAFALSENELSMRALAASVLAPGASTLLSLMLKCGTFLRGRGRKGGARHLLLTPALALAQASD